MRDVSYLSIRLYIEKIIKVAIFVGIYNYQRQHHGVSQFLEELLSPIVSCLKIYTKHNSILLENFCLILIISVLASCDFVSFYRSILHYLNLEALSYWIYRKLNLITKRFTEVFDLEAAS